MTIRNRQAFITFESLVSALMAKRALHDYKIEELDVVFKLSFVEGNESEDETANPNSALAFMKSAAKVHP